ncbi:MAG: TatD family hydrolase [Treponema sp.]
MFVDAHNHVLDYLEELTGDALPYPSNFSVCFCASSNEKVRFIQQKKICDALPQKAYYSFGVHPQAPSNNELQFLEDLLKQKEIIAIGECGFDLFDDRYKATIEMQKEVWNAQVELAIKYQKPLIIHCRKALHLIFNDVEKLKKIKAVIFHGWVGSFLEATSLLKKGVNAYFCIGKALLRGQKSQIEMANSFDISRLLTETDAPYMKLKEEAFSSLTDISYVVNEISKLRRIEKEELKQTFFNNFNLSFDL